MNTHFVGIKEFRQDISGFVKKARMRKSRYVVMNRSTPLFEITPFSEKETLDSFFDAIVEGKKDKSRGAVHSEEEILRELA